MPSSSFLSWTFLRATSSPVCKKFAHTVCACMKGILHLDVLGLQHNAVGAFTYSSNDMVVLKMKHHCGISAVGMVKVDMLDAMICN